MGAAIHDFVRERLQRSARDWWTRCGLQFHEEPWVSYVSERGTEMLMVPGMMFTIEPMVNMGKPDVFVDADDDWTVYTEDGKPSAQWGNPGSGYGGRLRNHRIPSPKLYRDPNPIQGLKYLLPDVC